MKRKLLLPILMICFDILAFGGLNVSAKTYGDLTYTITNGEVTIKDCAESATEVVIPKTIDDCPVTSIDVSAFYYCTSLTSVTISDSVTSIGIYAFSNCTNLTSVTIPDSVTSIGNNAFSHCTSLTSITISDSVTSIGNYAFFNCTSLTSITISDSVTSIGYYAFAGCTSLSDITIPDSVTSVGHSAFSGCTSLINITFPDNLTSIDGATFVSCTNLTSVTIPDSVTSIDYQAFFNCTSLTRVNITDISSWCNIDFGSSEANPLCNGAELYLNDELVTNLVIPDGVTSIGNYLFNGCTSLTSVTIPNSVTSIGKNAFSGCTSLTRVTIPDSVTSIEEQAFFGCTSLINIIIPDGVTSIGQQAFDECTSLTSVTIPDSVTSIGSWAFDNCTSLTKVNITNIAAWCNINFNDPFANPLLYAKNLYLNDKLVTDLVIPQEVKNIKAHTFYKCTSLKSVKFHENISNINSWAFSYCTNLENIYIEKGLLTVVEFAFNGCPPVENIYYSGSEEDWNKIVIESDNSCLTNRDVITFGAVIPKIYVSSTNGGSAFTDVEANAWYYDVVKTAIEKGLMNGISDTEFAPMMNLTRGMFVTVLFRAGGEPDVEYSQIFSDVELDKYYSNAVVWATENNIVNGMTKNEFMPDEKITREQMATIIARFAQYKGLEVIEDEAVVYADNDNISNYAKEAVKITKMLGILEGNEDGSFAPKRNASRAEAAAVFVRLLDIMQ